jgi:hypothetical protein
MCGFRGTCRQRSYCCLQRTSRLFLNLKNLLNIACAFGSQLPAEGSCGSETHRLEVPATTGSPFLDPSSIFVNSCPISSEQWNAIQVTSVATPWSALSLWTQSSILVQRVKLASSKLWRDNWGRCRMLRSITWLENDFPVPDCKWKTCFLS